MSNKTKRLSQILFRRSSSANNGPIKPPRREICYQHQNQSHYENLMSVGFGLGEIGHSSSSVDRDDDKEETEDESAPLIPVAVTHLVQNKEGPSKVPFGRVLIFGDKTKSNISGSGGSSKIRAKSCSPCRSSNYCKTNLTRLPSILKNANMQKNHFHQQNNENSKREQKEGQFFNAGKSTLQRTKSSPNPVTSINGKYVHKAIPVQIPCPPKRRSSSVATLSQSNPLLNVSWKCPTIEKRKDSILNYFKKLSSNKEEQGNNFKEKREPIYEEIQEICKNSNISSSSLDSLKPKISPKKVRLNLFPTYDNVTEDDDESKSFYQEPTSTPAPIYDKLLTRSASFCSNNWTESEQPPQGSSSPNSQTESTCARQWIQTADSFANLTDPVLLSDAKSAQQDENNKGTAQKTDGLGEMLSIANFASQVALIANTTQHARDNRVYSRSRSNSFNSGLLSNSHNLVSSSASFNHGVVVADTTTRVCDMDEIYLKLDKRGKKVGTPTTRLLKRHQSLIGKCAEDDFYINSVVSASAINTSDYKANIIIGDDNIYANIELPPECIDTFHIKSEDSEAESGFSLEEGEIEFDVDSTTTATRIPRIKISCEVASTTTTLNPTSQSEDSCYSCTNSSNSSAEEGEEESESLKPQHLHQQQQLPPARTAWATNKAKPNTASLKNFFNPDHQKLNPDLDHSSTVVTSDSDNFITNVCVEKDDQKNHLGFTNFADVFPHIDSETTNSVLTISVIDSTQSNPRSDTYPVSETSEAEKKLFLSHISTGLNFNWDWYLSLKKGIVALDPSVTVIHQTPKKNRVADFFPKSETIHTIDFYEQSEQNCGNSTPPKPQDNFSEAKNMAMMSASALMTPTSIKDDKLPSSSGLLIETQNLWDTSSSPSPPSSSSPNSHSSEPELSSSADSTTTNSDLSEISVQLVTMTESSTRNKFIHQDSKYYDDVDEDGGFESFQVVDPDVENGYDYENSGSDENQGEFLGINESQALRQRTFAQLSQNIPEQELKQKASSVLDLINAEISDLHMRELELKRKNRVADGKEDENDSEDLVEVEGSSQADSEDYSDSAVDVESYSRTSNSSGNVTPADREKNQREGSGSPQSYRGEYHPADVEASEKEVLIDATQDETTGTSSSVLVDISVDVEADESTSSGTGAGKQQGVKVRPIAEEEVKSIELSVTKETPIEREIRLVREREEEFRRMRNVSSTTTSGDVADSPTLTTPTKVKAQEPDKKVVSRSASVSSAKAFFGNDAPGNAPGPKDIQYEMATARLKREIEENNMRERELYREGRLKSLSVLEPEKITPQSPSERSDEESDTGTPNSEEESEIFYVQETTDTQAAAVESSPVEEKEEHNIKPSTGRRPLIRIPSCPAAANNTFKTSPTGSQSAPANTHNSMRFFTPNPFSPGTPPSPQSLTFQNRSPAAFSSSGSQSLAFSKPQFTSIERMILKGSFSFNMISEEPARVQEDVRLAKVSMMPDPLQIVHRQESKDETDEGEVQVEEKPRRKYIQAQDKIQKELQEQSKREKELSQVRAKWKSTPDLSKLDEKSDEVDDEETLVEEGEGLTKPSSLKRHMSSSTQKLSISEDVSTTDVLRMNKPTVRRRHSALINQWEEMIKQQQQKNSKN